MGSTSGEAGPSFATVLPHVVESVGEARRMLREDLQAHGAPLAGVQDAMVVISELVANSLRHAAPTADGGVRVAWRIQPDVVLVQVTDGGGAGPPRETPAGTASTGGRGLTIVRRLSNTWGYEPEDGTMTVYAAVPLRG